MINYLLVCDRHQSVLAAASAYGTVSTITGSSLAYCGQFPDPRTEIYYLGNGHRGFNAALMRFISPDALSPFGVGGVNIYAYFQGDPINHQDNETVFSVCCDIF
ncbi:RHS repeat-associated core domain-containing protein [Pseudomonas sp. CCOS 191]|uniref:RHS repeat-associated core domain-containing protein n=1 Tax=Pseudomonas sp. CCOS 191 TaxID=1649877 RepID=UPI002FCD9C31